MATIEHTLPAQAGKADEAVRLISDMLSALENTSQGLRRLQHWPDKARLVEEAYLLRVVARDVWDAEDNLQMVMEVLAEPR